MKKKEIFIRLFRTRNYYYIYDVGADLFIKIPKHTYLVLESYLTKEQNIDELIEQDDVIRSLIEQNYMLTPKAEEIIHPKDKLITYYLENAIGMITLQITQQCNLRCKYCTYSGNYSNRSHSNQEMKIETAKKGIDFILNHSKDLNRIVIGFYGGEPLLKMGFIKECIDYAKGRGEGKEIEFYMTTNGTLLNMEAVETLQLNKVRLTISLDGPRDIHDKNRTFINGMGTFDKILSNLEEMMKYYPDYVKKYVMFNVVMDGSSDLCCINNFFMDASIIKDLNKRSGVVNELYTNNEIEKTPDFHEQIKYEKFKIMLEKLDKLNKKYTSSLFTSEIEKIKELLSDTRNHQNGIPQKIHHGGPCLPGVNRLFMNTQGVFYPCERVSESSEPMQIGHVDFGFNIDKIRALLNIGKTTEEKCKNCWAYRYCYMCAAFGDDIDKLSGSKKACHCIEVQNYVHDIFVIYCTMKEFGYNFDSPEFDNVREIQFSEE